MRLDDQVVTKVEGDEQINRICKTNDSALNTDQWSDPTRRREGNEVGPSQRKEEAASSFKLAFGKIATTEPANVDTLNSVRSSLPQAISTERSVNFEEVATRPRGPSVRQSERALLTKGEAALSPSQKLSRANTIFQVLGDKPPELAGGNAAALKAPGIHLPKISERDVTSGVALIHGKSDHKPSDRQAPEDSEFGRIKNLIAAIKSKKEYLEGLG